MHIDVHKANNGNANRIFNFFSVRFVWIRTYFILLVYFSLFTYLLAERKKHEEFLNLDVMIQLS